MTEQTAMNQSDSTVQIEAKPKHIALLAEELGVALEPADIQVRHTEVKVDGASADRSILVEVYARIGTLKSSQLKKVGMDVLKLNRLGRKYPAARRVIVLGSQSAADSIGGWLKEEIDDTGVEMFVLPLDEAGGSKVVAAQERQKMVQR